MWSAEGGFHHSFKYKTPTSSNSLGLRHYAVSFKALTKGGMITYTSFWKLSKNTLSRLQEHQVTRNSEKCCFQQTEAGSTILYCILIKIRNEFFDLIG